MAWGKKAALPAAPVHIDRTKNKVRHREDIVTLDFETYYDTDYSLSKYSYSEYIRDKRFEAIICGIKIGTKKTVVVEGPKLRAAFLKIPWKEVDLLCHNTAFDGFIMSHHYGVVPRMYLDTLGMARGLFGNDVSGGLDSVSQYLGGTGKVNAAALESAKGKHLADLKKESTFGTYKDYCGKDVDDCYDIFHQMSEIMPPGELAKIDIFIRAFCDPVLGVDRERVKKELAREIAEKERILFTAVGSPSEQARLIKLLGRDGALSHCKKEIGSPKKFAEILTDMGVKPPMKISPTTGMGIYAFSKTDEDFLVLREHPNKAVRDIVEARISVKSSGNETKAQRFLDVSENGYKLPVLLNYYAAHTGRPGGGNKMNMLNLERGGELRKSILAPEGMEICVADSGQIEARIAMWISDQLDALEEFAMADDGVGRDPYCIFADSIYGHEVDKVLHPAKRFVGKVGKLSLQYQAGPPRFQTMLALGALGGPPTFIEIEEAQRIVYLFRRRHSMLVRFWDMCRDKIIPDMAAGREGEWKCLKWEKERVWFPNGMCLKYPGLRKHVHEEGTEYTYLRKGEPSKIYGGLLTENIVQGLANVIITEQMVKIAAKYRIVMMTYDENCWIAPKKDVVRAFKFGMDIMGQPPAWCPDLPLKADGVHAVNYAKT